MAKWLYNSSGTPVAFIRDDKVFSKHGRFVGRLDGDEVWHSRYIGEILRGDRFLYDTKKGSVIRGTPSIPGTPGIPGLPGLKGTIVPPVGYQDVELKD